MLLKRLLYIPRTSISHWTWKKKKEISNVPRSCGLYMFCFIWGLQDMDVAGWIIEKYWLRYWIFIEFLSENLSSISQTFPSFVFFDQTRVNIWLIIKIELSKWRVAGERDEWSTRMDLQSFPIKRQISNQCNHSFLSSFRWARLKSQLNLRIRLVCR